MGCCTSSSSVREIKLRAEEDDVDAEDTLSEANIRLKAEARSMFAMVDDDGSGFLDRGELEKLIKMLLPAAEDAEKLLSVAEIDAAMQEMDDDASGTITFQEFFRWWKRRKEREAEAANCWGLEDVADPSAGLSDAEAATLTNGRERHSTLTSARHALSVDVMAARSASNAASPGRHEMISAGGDAAAIAMAELGISGENLGASTAPKRRKARRMSVVALANEELANEGAMWTVSSAVAGGKSDEARVAQAALKREKKRKNRKSMRQTLQGMGCGCCMTSDRKRAAAAESTKRHDPRVQCRKMFNQIDEDGSGSLDVDEIPKLAALLGMKLNETQKHMAMKEMDADSSGSIDFEEFCQWYLKTGGHDDPNVSSQQAHMLFHKPAFAIRLCALVYWSDNAATACVPGTVPVLRPRDNPAR